jgi:hypothetical protein
LLRIRMRIRIFGSIPLTNGSDADPGGPKTCYFCQNILIISRGPVLQSIGIFVAKKLS